MKENYLINLSQKEINIILTALEHVTRLGIWNDEYQQLINKLNQK